MKNNCAKTFKNLAEDALDRVVALTQAVCEVPAPTNHEAERGRFVANALKQRNLEPEIDDIGNVIARRKGRGDQPTLLVAAHIDTVFPADTDLAVTRTATTMTGPGVGDNCVAVACMIMLAELLDAAQIQTPGDLLLVGNVGEEGLGNLRGIRAVVDRYEAELGGVLVLEGHLLGRVTHQAVGSKRIRVTLTGPGGHSWGAFGQPSAIHVLGEIIHQITRLSVPEDPKTTYNVGVIEGGGSVNTIAPTASALIDMRSVDPAALATLASRIEHIIEQQRTDAIKPFIEVVGERPAGVMPVQTPIVQQAIDVLRSLDIEPNLSASSTDANIPIARGIPSVCIGLTHGRDSHRVDETIELQPITLGLRQLLHLVNLFPVKH